MHQAKQRGIRPKRIFGYQREQASRISIESLGSVANATEPAMMLDKEVGQLDHRQLECELDTRTD
jgi:hypothetical protein